MTARILVLFTASRRRLAITGRNAAKAKLNEMWLRVTDRLDYFQNAEGNDNEFSYDHPTSINTSERIRFYIAKL